MCLQHSDATRTTGKCKTAFEIEDPMNRAKTIAFIFCICLIPAVLNAAPQPLRSIGYLGYNSQTGLNDLSQTSLYQYPDPNRFGPGAYAVFMWTPGTYQWFVDPMSVTFVTQMAAR